MRKVDGLVKPFIALFVNNKSLVNFFLSAISCVCLLELGIAKETRFCCISKRKFLSIPLNIFIIGFLAEALLGLFRLHYSAWVQSVDNKYVISKADCKLPRKQKGDYSYHLCAEITFVVS